MRAVASDDQLGNRFESFDLPAWKFGLELGSLVVSLTQSFGMRDVKGTANDECLREILVQTDGVLGRIVRLLQNAAICAVRDGSQRVTLDTLVEQRARPPLVSMVLSHK
jgi:hypothetical protein